MKLSSVLLLATASLVSARAYREKVLDIKGKNFFDAFDFWTVSFLFWGGEWVSVGGWDADMVVRGMILRTVM